VCVSIDAECNKVQRKPNKLTFQAALSLSDEDKSFSSPALVKYLTELGFNYFF